MRRWVWRALLALLLIGWGGAMAWQLQKPLPPGVRVAGAWEPTTAAQVRFLRDQTAADATGQPLVERQIQSALLQIIAQANTFILLDAGLFGDLPAMGPAATRLRSARPLAAELVEALARRQGEMPSLQILLLTDPSSMILRQSNAQFDTLRAAGIDALAVDVGRLREPNAAFLTLSRLCCTWWNGGSNAGSWPNPAGVGPASVSFGAWAQLRSYQRSHRQLLIADDGAGQLTGMIFSRPLHAEAGIHSATALQLHGAALEPLLEAEFVVAQFSGWTDRHAMQEQAQRMLKRQSAQATAPSAHPGESARARVLSEGAIADQLVARIDAAGKGDEIDIAALYLSQRELVRALTDAGRRGVAVRVLLDPGKDGYGYARDGVPNRQVASELVSVSDGAVRVRWYRTHGEQFSPGLAMVRTATRTWLMVGTAELSRRDLDDFNLAAAFVADLPATAVAAADALNWFDALWYNRASGGTEYTTDVDVYADASQLNYWRYRLFEVSGISFD